MEELLQLTRENNQMLKEILTFIHQYNSQDQQMNREVANLLTNVIANLMVWKQSRM